MLLIMEYTLLQLVSTITHHNRKVATQNRQPSSPTLHTHQQPNATLTTTPHSSTTTEHSTACATTQETQQEEAQGGQWTTLETAADRGTHTHMLCQGCVSPSRPMAEWVKVPYTKDTYMKHWYLDDGSSGANFA